MTEDMATSFDRVRKMQMHMQRYGSGVRTQDKSSAKKFHNLKYLLLLPSIQKSKNKEASDYSPSGLSLAERQVRDQSDVQHVSFLHSKNQSNQIITLNPNEVIPDKND